MDIYDFYRLFQLHGGYALPALIEAKSPALGSLYFTNNPTDVMFENTLYKATPMAYNPPSTQNGTQSGGSLEIDIESSYADTQGATILNYLDNADEQIELIIKAVILEEQHIKKIAQVTHKYGSASWDGERIIWNLGEDDRLQMAINPWALDSVSLEE
jgi:predicted RNase H-like HicB family nuclease